MIQYGGRLVDGWSLPSEVVYVDENGVTTKTQFKVADGTSEGAQTIITVFVDKDETTYYSLGISTKICIPGCTYSVSGKVVPVNDTVHLSYINDDTIRDLDTSNRYVEYLASNISLDELKANEFASVQGDENGNWHYDNIKYASGKLVAFTYSKMAFENVSYDVTCELNLVSIDEDLDNKLKYISFDVPGANPNDKPINTNNGANYYVPVVTITGNNIGNDNIYVSKCSTSDTINAELLISKLVYSTIADNNKFTFKFKDRYQNNTSSSYPYEKYYVWKLSNSDMSANLTYVEELQTCLSGDTEITMADNSVRRLDEIRVGDTVLGGDKTHTKVIFTNHGLYNTYHTLYTFSDGTVIDEVHDHRFYNVEQGFWQLLRKWNIGEHARKIDGSEVELIKIEKIDEKKEMFGMWTESRDYWANGLLSGETAANQNLLSTATAEQAADMMASLDEKLLLQVLGLEGLLP